MTVKYLTKEEKPESRWLWDEAFPEDSESFKDYYFKEKSKDNRILAIIGMADGTAAPVKDAGEERLPSQKPLPGAKTAVSWRIEAMIHLNPYLLQAGSCHWKVDYLVGVATRREKRHRGYMTMLLKKILKDLHEEQMPFCFLMPANPEIYLPFGFTFIFRQPKWEWRPGVAKKLRKHSLLPDAANGKDDRYLAEAASWMNRWLEERYQVFAIRDEAYLHRLAREIASEDGNLDIWYDGDRIAGIQSEWGLDKREQRLLYAKEKYVQMEDEPKPAIMARIISPERFLEAVGLWEEVTEQEICIRLRVDDSLIDESGQTWIWYVGHGGSRLEKRSDDSMFRAADREAPDLELTVTELTAWILGGEMPGQAERYAGYIKPLCRVFLDEVV